MCKKVGHALRHAISPVDAHNDEGKPFKWTKTADGILAMKRFGQRTVQVHGGPR